MEMHCGQELQKALKQSSIKGVPKLLIVKSKYLKVLWMLATVAFLFIGFYQSYTLLEEYFQYPKLTLLQERDYSTETSSVFPNILVCNVNQLGLFRNLPMDQNIEVYEETVRNYTECSNCTAEEVEWRTRIRGHLISPYAYLQYLGRAKAIEIASKYENFLVECLAFKDNNVIGNACADFAAAVKVVPSAEYFSCLIVGLPAEEKITEVTMTFYIDSFETSSAYRSTNFWAYKSTGVAYYVFSPSDKVFPRIQESKAPPGTMTTVSVRREVFHRLSEPHGNCISTQEYGGSGQCYDDCLNRAVWKQCDCNPATNLFNPGDKEACLSVLLPKAKLIRYQDGANHTIWTVSGQCSDSCRLGCSETRYKTQPSYARCPIPYQAESFYRQFVESKPYSKMFETPSVPHSTDNENLEN